MMRNIGWRKISHAWVWLKRIRHRCGYGVHSPFAFDYITNVIYEKTPYYAYESLEREWKRGMKRRGSAWGREASRKVRRLLFRVVNRAQPDFALYLGPDSAVIPFLQAARQGMTLQRRGLDEALNLPPHTKLDLLVVDAERLEDCLPEVWNCCAPFLHSQSVVVLRGVGFRANRRCWEDLKNRPETGITFDLYDLGIVFMDHDKIKQHYLVNF